MTGLAKTSQMLLSTATVMIGPTADLHKLNVADHSIGLVKNVQVASDPTYVELGQGLTNDTVISVRNGDGLRLSMEVYEFTLRNLAYGMGLDAAGVAYDPITVLTTTTAALAANASTVPITAAANIAAGDFIFIQDGVGDHVHIAKVASIATLTLTLATGYEVPKAMATGARVGKVKMLKMGGTIWQPTLAAKIVGLLPETNTPITYLIPKMKIQRGFNMAFSSENFANMPFELMPYAGLPTDPFYSEYGPSKLVMFPR